MKLYLVRHGDYVSSDIDPEQPLSEKGIRETEAVANLLEQAPIEIDEILHSEKRRAQQTAKILAKSIAPYGELIPREGFKPWPQSNLFWKKSTLASAI